MPIRTRRWNDPIRPGDGLRVLICRYRPRALPKAKETWDVWKRELSPSVELHQKRYLAEMKERKAEMRAPAEKVKAGETVTLLCSSACTDEAHCHRTLLKKLIEAEAAPAHD